MVNLRLFPILHDLGGPLVAATDCKTDFIPLMSFFSPRLRPATDCRLFILRTWYFCIGAVS